MKYVALILGSLMALLTPAFCQEAKTNVPVKIKAAVAKDNIGTNAVVAGKVVEVNKAPNIVRLNFDEPFPHQTFTAVIFASKTNLFPDVEKLQGKNVEVTGKIVAYRDRPQ